jgi:hypothetical protein
MFGRRKRESMFNVLEDKRDGWWWCAVSPPFSRVWPAIRDKVRGEKILVTSLDFWWPGRMTTSDFGERAARLHALQLLSVFTVAEWKDVLLLIDKQELDKLAASQSRFELQWVDYSNLFNDTAPTEIYTEHFKDDMFESELLHALVSECNGSMTFHLVSSGDIRIECRDRATILALLRLEIEELAILLRVERQIDPTTKQLEDLLGRLMHKTAEGKAPYRFEAVDLIDSGPHFHFMVDGRGQKFGFTVDTRQT